MASQRGDSSLSLIDRFRLAQLSHQNLTRFRVYPALKLSGGESLHRSTRGGSGFSLLLFAEAVGSIDSESRLTPSQWGVIQRVDPYEQAYEQA
jgi:hypothetical protein